MSWLKLKKLVFRHAVLLFLLLLGLCFFWRYFCHGLLPVPADTIVGLYHPWRDRVWNGFINGVPFKNFLITDPVRQMIPWRSLAIRSLIERKIPLWNPYHLSGTPLLANFQSAVFYPLNILFAFLPFATAWSWLIMLQCLLAGFFLFLYLQNLKLKKPACFLGALSFSFSGFFMAWLEWGTILHAALWLPLILLAIDKILSSKNVRLFNRYLIKWSLIFVFSLCFSFLAGHLQTSFYLILFSIIYLSWRLWPLRSRRLKVSLLFIILYASFVVLVSPQWLPTLQLIELSARSLDQADWKSPGWFLPWAHLIQFIAPDFFGNPVTLNYWGTWNYGELVGFIGTVPLILSFVALVSQKDQIETSKATKFFALSVLIFLSFSLPTPWAKWMFRFQVPFLATAQPTRLLFLVDFGLSVLAGFGLNWLMQKSSFKEKIPTLLKVMGFWVLVLLVVWGYVLLSSRFWSGNEWTAHMAVAKRNLILPTALFIALSLIFFFTVFADKSRKKSLVVHYCLPIVVSGIIFLTIFDLFRFGWKFNPFVNEDWLFPSVSTIEFLQKDRSVFRIMNTDDRLMPPNFAAAYQLQTVDGYDPLYLQSYAELIAASERGEPNIEPPFGFNRIITPQNFESKIIDLLNVKYILSLSDLDSKKLELVFQDGETRVYLNREVLPRAFLVGDYRLANDKQEAIEMMMDRQIDLTKTAILSEPIGSDLIGMVKPGESKDLGTVEIVNYEADKVVIKTQSEKPALLVLTDSDYPGWKVLIDGQKKSILKANYNFRAVSIPAGEHQVMFLIGPFFN